MANLFSALRSRLSGARAETGISPMRDLQKFGIQVDEAPAPENLATETLNDAGPVPRRPTLVSKSFWEQTPSDGDPALERALERRRSASARRTLLRAELAEERRKLEEITALVRSRTAPEPPPPAWGRKRR